MSSIPERLQHILETFDAMVDRADREMLLFDYAERFKPVPQSVATRPYPDDRKVPYCESEGYVWVIPESDGTITPYYAVENPSGISAKALAAILHEGLRGSSPEEAATISEDIVERIFRRNISMGKGLGLTSMVRATAEEANAIWQKPRKVINI